MSAEAAVHTPLLGCDADVEGAGDAALSAALEEEAALAAEAATAGAEQGQRSSAAAASPARDPRTPRGWCAALGVTADAAGAAPQAECDDELATWSRLGVLQSLLLLGYALARICALGPFPDDAVGARRVRLRRQTLARLLRGTYSTLR